MNKKQVSLMFDKLWKVGKKSKYDAICAVIFDDMRPSEAERVFDVPVNTVARDVKRLTDGIEFCELIVNAGKDEGAD
ncbi:hypothetical protein AB4455_18305 [Vibrio sp. 10N.261.46.E12]|uniref:hypothetical protein n=1 Tax=unclassified Vibrio TaxID=2614977 RepID=UPI0009785845|nr:MULTISPECIES: hypothetical protein [unclassified Vibrio]OMO32501.1 hypothetical protein BH584_16360 [Vibrio sp. 10N.261.45.E1]PMJ34262.1 hypothetical protein BCU27_24815 [Vibrio sp. 10N.286.45.B6]PMM72964.1 hypothetical protein BCT48_05510 [Vibrio sp. 10N.261.46.F12]PMM90585.1 hypothetical protein BCT46_22375 [Vibrio sp. 10N.261.46.E8]PMN42803.1 hypothetical protein BCT34_02150 [Vibrio sp. 10N.261.45.E2]